MAAAPTYHCYQCHRTRPAVTRAQRHGLPMLCPWCLGLARLRLMRSPPADETPIEYVWDKGPGNPRREARGNGRVIRSGKEMS